MSNIDWGAEAKMRYRAARRGFCVMQTRGREYERRKTAGAGTYMLIDQATNGVILHAASLVDIAVFLQDHDQDRRHQLH